MLLTAPVNQLSLTITTEFAPKEKEEGVPSAWLGLPQAQRDIKRAVDSLADAGLGPIFEVGVLVSPCCCD